jgi:hypothetical protein
MTPTPPPLRVWLLTAILLGLMITLAGVAKLVFDVGLDVLI